MTKITIDGLSEKSVQNAINELRKYQKSLERKTQLVAKKLAELGVEVARMNVVGLDAVFTGDLARSIHVEDKGKVGSGYLFCVVADDESALFVEFGTGVVGERNPYSGNIPIDWDYASGKKIKEYFINGKLVYGWFYPGIDGKWHFTQGIPSRPFMTMTATELQSKVVDVVKEVFANG